MEAFVINQKVEFRFSNSTLSSTNDKKVSPIKLDYLESIVLKLLVMNPNCLVTYEEFLSHWRSTEVTENALSRVISLLRKKLKQVGITTNAIVNTAKKGYTFVAHVELIAVDSKSSVKARSEISNEIKTKEVSSFSRFSKRLASLAFILFASLIINLISLKVTSTDGINIEHASYIELLSNDDIKIELAYSPFSDHIAYSTKAFNEEFWKVRIQHRYNNESFVLEEQEKNLNKPSWLSSNELIYRLYDETSCEVKKATIDFRSSKISSVKLFSCNPDSYASAIARFGSNKVLIADTEFNNTASSLFIGDLQTGEIEKVNINNEGGAGFYNIITTPHSELVALLSSSDGIKFKIQLVDPFNEWLTIWFEELKANNFSVGWDGSSLSFKNDNGGISVVSFYGHDEHKRTNVPTLNPTNNIATTNNGIMMSSGEFISQDLSLYNSTTSELITFTQGTSSINKLAQFYSDNQVIYVSNKTGINQIWSLNVLTKQSKQLSSFTTNKDIRALALDSHHSFVAIQAENTIELYSLGNSLKLSSLLTQVTGVNPEFFDQELIFTEYDGVTSNAASLSLDSFVRANLHIEAAFYVKKNGDNLLYSKRYLPGIWQYNANSKDELLLDLPSSSYQWLVNENKIYYQNDIGNYFQYDLKTKVLSPFNQPNCNRPTALKGSMCLSKSLLPSENRLILLEWK